MGKQEKYFGHEYMSKTGRVLRLMREKKTVTNAELNKICFRYGAVIHNLRNEGWLIRTIRMNNDGLFVFILDGHIDDKKGFVRRRLNELRQVR